MAPKKPRDVVKERQENEEALKKEVPFADLIAALKTMKPEKADSFDSYLAKYQAGQLRARKGAQPISPRAMRAHLVAQRSPFHFPVCAQPPHTRSARWLSAWRT
jgi:hypothetical protein